MLARKVLLRPLPRMASLSAARLRALPSTLRAFSTAAVARPSKDISHLPKLKDPIAAEAEKQLAAGNVAEAYGLHPDAGVFGNSGLWEKFGFATTVGWFAVAAISKEWYILDPETVLMSTFATSAFVAYVSFREPVSQAVEEEQKAQHDLVNAAVDAELDQLDATKAELKELLEVPKQVLPELTSAVKHTLAAASAYETTFAAQLNQNVEKQLQLIEQQENKFFDDLRNAAAVGAIEHVKQAFSSGPDASKMRASSVDNAIASLKGGKAQNLITPIVTKYLQDFDKSVVSKKADFQSKLKQQLETATIVPHGFPTQEHIDANAKNFAL